MDRKRQNDIILSKLAEKFQDMPNVQDVLDKTFTGWFRGLVAKGAEAMNSAPKPSSGAEGAEGGAA